MKAEGYVILKGELHHQRSQTTDDKKKWSLRELLAEHAPDQLEKLKFGVHPLGDASTRTAWC